MVHAQRPDSRYRGSSNDAWPHRLCLLLNTQSDTHHIHAHLARHSFHHYAPLFTPHTEHSRGHQHLDQGIIMQGRCKHSCNEQGAYMVPRRLLPSPTNMPPRWLPAEVTSSPSFTSPLPSFSITACSGFALSLTSCKHPHYGIKAVASEFVWLNVCTRS